MIEARNGQNHVRGREKSVPGHVIAKSVREAEIERSDRARVREDDGAREVAIESDAQDRRIEAAAVVAAENLPLTGPISE